MTTKFTPAPWVAKRNSAYWEVSKFDVNGRFECGVGDAGSHGPVAPSKQAEQQANAQLMAAAPEMYELLLLVLTDDHVYGNMTTDTLNKIYAVLAKARGEQP